MVSSDSPLVEVQEIKTKTGGPRKCALSSHNVDPDAIGSPENEYVQCSNQNGTVQSPVWTFFTLRKSDLETAQLGLRQCYCKVAGCGAVGQLIFATQLLQMPAPKAKLFSHEITQI